jgi:hypothetical protein
LGALTLQRGRRLCVLAPRGSAKSTWSTLAYPLRCAVEGTEPYIVLTADTGNQASKYLDSIRSELENNTHLAAHYPHSCGKGPVWRGDRLELRNGVAIETLGTGSKVRGRRHRQHRPTLLVVDDPQNVEHVVSPLMRERSWDWFTKDVCNAGGPDTNLVVLGTALHRDCIVCRLQRTPGWKAQVFQSIITWPARMDLWRLWEEMLHDWENPNREQDAREFYEENREEMES